jgi:hypothetical protein
MPVPHTVGQRPSHVTVRFSDGAHSVPLSRSATFFDLADCIESLGVRHAFAPTSISVAFDVRAVQPGSLSSRTH